LLLFCLLTLMVTQSALHADCQAELHALSSCSNTQFSEELQVNTRQIAGATGIFWGRFGH